MHNFFGIPNHLIPFLRDKFLENSEGFEYKYRFTIEIRREEEKCNVYTPQKMFLLAFSFANLKIEE